MAKTKLKLLYLSDILNKYTDSSNRKSAEELCTILSNEYGLEVERKTIYRDISTLHEYGMDIVQSNTGYYVKSRVFRPAEIKLLVSAVQAAGFITQIKSDSLISKLTSFLSNEQGEITKSFVNIAAPKCSNEEIYKTIDAVNNAIYNEKKLSFYYVKRDAAKNYVIQNNAKRYNVSPYAMLWMHDRYYLVANMEGREDLTHFRLDRMKSTYEEQLPRRHFREVSDYKTYFDATDYKKKCLNMFGGTIRHVDLKCHNSIIDEILERFGEDVKIKICDDEHFIASVVVAASDGFFAWTAQFFDRIEIMSPRDVKGIFAEKINKLCKMYPMKGK